MTVYNFNPGPAVLPKEVLIQAQKEFLDYHGLGYSILEASHRSPEFEEIIESAELSLRKLLNIPDDYAVLFLQGGASLQFAMVPMNLLPPGRTADYIDTGEWSSRAYKEAANLGSARVILSSKSTKYDHIPTFSPEYCTPNAAYLHITSNNTIYGTQYRTFPTPPDGIPLIADMSSDILSRQFDIKQFGLIYAGAQKNMGPSGVTIVIIHKELAKRAPANLPTMLNYNTHITNRSLYNTPPTFSIYIVRLVCDYLLQRGGIPAIEAINEAKAKLLYDEIDRDQFYRGTVQPAHRSKMNVPFRLATEELEKEFLKQAEKAGLIGLKGHRSVGGIRASLYNAMPIEGVQALVSFMQEFRRTHG